ncbi:hypothetical protein TPA0906_24190 [Streptomyces olivaceus]|nr:hypothetical protein TPA0906_24190 [Streptomyces olivaceus]
MTTRTGVTTGSLLASGSSGSFGMRRLRPLADHLVQCARNVGDGVKTAEDLVRISVPNRNVDVARGRSAPGGVVRIWSVSGNGTLLPDPATPGKIQTTPP